MGSRHSLMHCTQPPHPVKNHAKNQRHCHFVPAVWRQPGFLPGNLPPATRPGCAHAVALAVKNRWRGARCHPSGAKPGTAACAGSKTAKPATATNATSPTTATTATATTSPTTACACACLRTVTTAFRTGPCNRWPGRTRSALTLGGLAACCRSGSGSGSGSGTRVSSCTVPAQGCTGSCCTCPGCVPGAGNRLERPQPGPWRCVTAEPPGAPPGGAHSCCRA